MNANAEKTLEARTVFKGRLLRVEVLDVELPGGRRAVREVVRHPGAVVVLPRLSDGTLILVRQFRKAAEESLLEAVAGTLEPGEAPESCARRELREETGMVARRLTPLGLIYPAPGYTDERLHLFAADGVEVDGDPCPEGDERITVERLSPTAFAALVRDGGVRDAKTLAIWALATARESTAGLPGGEI